MKWQKIVRMVYQYEDADPAHVMFARTEMQYGQKLRSLVSWIMYHHGGFAPLHGAHEGKKFWDYAEHVYKTAPRATERRHFRGPNGAKAISEWRKAYPHPEAMIEDFLSVAPNYFSIKAHLQKLPQFGPYWVWKMCDLYEFTGKQRIDMNGAWEHANSSPRQGAKLIDPSATLGKVFDIIQAECKGILVPPYYDRGVGHLEAETICCIVKQLDGAKYLPGVRATGCIAELDEIPSKWGEEFRHSMLMVSGFDMKHIKNVWETCHIAKGGYDGETSRKRSEYKRRGIHIF